MNLKRKILVIFFVICSLSCEGMSQVNFMFTKIKKIDIFETESQNIFKVILKKFKEHRLEFVNLNSEVFIIDEVVKNQKININENDVFFGEVLSLAAAKIKCSLFVEDGKIIISKKRNKDRYIYWIYFPDDMKKWISKTSSQPEIHLNKFVSFPDFENNPEIVYCSPEHYVRLLEFKRLWVAGWLSADSFSSRAK